MPPGKSSNWTIQVQIIDPNLFGAYGHWSLTIDHAMKMQILFVPLDCVSSILFEITACLSHENLSESFHLPLNSKEASLFALQD